VVGSYAGCMAVEIAVRYAGNKKCDLTHPEGAKIRTDAPKDIGGDASGFSPTDMVAGGLAACILTTMAMYAERNGLDLTGATAKVEKHMTQPPAPRRLADLPVVVKLPASVPVEWRERIERAGNSCPVHASLHPEVRAPITYLYE
jgi:putative redox protein